MTSVKPTVAPTILWLVLTGSLRSVADNSQIVQPMRAATWGQFYCRGRSFASNFISAHTPHFYKRFTKKFRVVKYVFKSNLSALSEIFAPPITYAFPDVFAVLFWRVKYKILPYECTVWGFIRCNSSEERQIQKVLTKLPSPYLTHHQFLRLVFEHRYIDDAFAHSVGDFVTWLVQIYYISPFAPTTNPALHFQAFQRSTPVCTHAAVWALCFQRSYRTS